MRRHERSDTGVLASAGPASTRGPAMQEPWARRLPAMRRWMNHGHGKYGWSGPFTGFLGGLYRPQPRPARPTTQNKIGWLGAVSVSGLNGSPGASATVGAEGGGAWRDKPLLCKCPNICTLWLYHCTVCKSCT